MTPLDKTLKRAVNIKGVEYVLTLSPEALKLTRKGKRLGLELKWADITSGESALAVALHASVGRFDSGDETEAAKSKPAPPKTVPLGKPVLASRRQVVTRKSPKKRRR